MHIGGKYKYSIIFRRLHSIILQGSTTPLKTPCIMRKAFYNTSTRAKEIFINFVSNVINGLTVNDDSKLYLTYPNHWISIDNTKSKT